MNLQYIRNNPTVTVLMAVYNGGEYLKEAVDSILKQTYEDFEFLIIEDGSTDQSLKILKSYKDHRIRIIQNSKNIGLIKSLNKGLKFANGKLIARMDADDISLPERFQKQIVFMKDNPEIGVCGTWLKTIGKTKKRVCKSPLKHEDICAKMFWDSTIWHATVFIRKKILIENNIFYNENFKRCEDYKLWVDLAKVTKFANIPEVLYFYRFHNSQVTKSAGNSQVIKNELIEELLGRFLTGEEIKYHEYLYFTKTHSDIKIMKDVEKWVEFLKTLNASNKKYAEPSFSQTFDKIKKNMYKRSFYYSLRSNKRYYPFLLSKLFLSEPKYYLYFSFIDLLKIFVKCFIFWPNKKFVRP